MKKNKETRVVAYTCRFFSGQLILIFQFIAVAELRPTRISAGVGYPSCFFTMIPIACKITKFSYTCSICIIRMHTIAVTTCELSNFQGFSCSKDRVISHIQNITIDCNHSL